MPTMRAKMKVQSITPYGTPVTQETLSMTCVSK